MLDIISYEIDQSDINLYYIQVYQIINFMKMSTTIDPTPTLAHLRCFE
jgi:hypothetical protein